jgi:hypothetical protein
MDVIRLQFEKVFIDISRHPTPQPKIELHRVLRWCRRDVQTTGAEFSRSRNGLLKQGASQASLTMALVDMEELKLKLVSLVPYESTLKNSRPN